MINKIDHTPRYNLNVVIRETGIKPDTLRAWERRYGLPQPERTEGGHRLYSQYDLETIKWLLARQQEDGLSISKAVNLWRSIEDKGRSPLDYSALEQLNDQLENGGAQEGEYLQNLCEQWLQACFLFDERRAEQSLTQAFALYPVEMVMIELIQKGLAHAGELWYQGEVTVQQEHFTTELAVRRINAMIAAAPAPIRTSSVIVGSSAGEPHSFPALLLTLFLRYRGWDVVYLGANVPLQRLNEVVTSVKPDLVVMTAMRLATAGTLLETANYLMEIDRPLAFGGRVFHTIPDLHRRIPGYYLGDSLPDGLSQIEALLSGPAPQILRDEKPEEFHQVIAQFRAHRPQIESQVLEAMFAKRDENIFPEYIRNANDFLAEDIIAGLKLGSMDLLDSDIVWLKGLLRNRGIPDELILNYLLAYHEAAKSHLGKGGQPIIDWLAENIEG